MKDINPLSLLLDTHKNLEVRDYRRILREAIQKICLLGLWRGTFFEHAAFYGGTALRIFHGLDRWSEDLDFSLLKEGPDIHLGAYLHFVKQELEAWGIIAKIDLADKKASQIESAFIKANTLKTLISLDIPTSALRKLHRDEISGVKFELDPFPPCTFSSESRFLLEPIPFSVRVMSLPDLFAGKMHAVLARSWENRVKGRDWYDLIWFVQHEVPLNLSHLEARLKQSGHLSSEVEFDSSVFLSLLNERINTINFEQAKEDIFPFVPNPKVLQNWSPELFKELLRKIAFD